MKKTILAFIAVLIVGNAWSQTKSIDTKEYSLSYNETAWSLLPKEKSPQLEVSLWYVEMFDNFNPNLNLLITELPDKQTTLDKYIKQSLAIYQSDKTKSQVKSTRIRNEKGEHEVITSVSSYKDNSIKMEQYVFVKNGKVYVLTFAASINSYPKLSAGAEAVMNSFKLK